nr:amidohydrolase family protein [Candidatus Poribacteria bacterium]
MSVTPDLAIVSQRVVKPNGVKPAAVLIKDEKIIDVLNIKDVPNDCPVENVGNNVVMPGVVDVHVHINEPGRTDWEGFETATKAACAGGITTLVDMPLNCIPVTTTTSALTKKITATQNKLWVNCGFYGGLIPENIDDLGPLSEAGVIGFKAFMSHSGIDEFPKITERELRSALPILAKYNLPLLVHAEMEDETHHGKDLHSYNSYMATRPKSWENNAIELLLTLCAEFQTPIHIVHLSSAEMLDEISQARANGLPITVETCPHYLYFSAE